MRSIILAALVLALVHQSFTTELSVSNCFLVLENQVGYNFLPWSNTQIFNVSAETVNNDNISIEYFMRVGFCGQYVNNDYGILTLTDGSNESFVLSNDASFTVANTAEMSDGFNVTYTSPNNSNSENAVVTFQFTCNSSQTAINQSFFNVTYSDFTGPTLYTTVTAQSYYACGGSLSQLLAFMSQYKFIFIPVFFILGAFFCFFGRRTFDVALFLIVAMAGLLISGSLFMQLTNIYSTPATKWVIFGVCVLIGVALGYLAIKFEKVGFFGLGLALGVVGGLFLYQLVLSPLLASHNNSSTVGTAVFWATVVILGLIGGGLGVWLYEDIKIISTAVIGAYTMIRAISVLIPNSFPPEIQVAEGTAQFTPVAYVYLALIIVFAILGIYVQFKHKKQEEDEKNENNEDYYRQNIPNDV